MNAARSIRRVALLATGLAWLATSGHRVYSAALQDRSSHGPDETRPLPFMTRLAPTAHPPLPARPSEFWMVPEPAAARVSAAPGPADALVAGFAKGVKLINDGSYTEGLPYVSQPGLASTPLASYARYYTGIAYLRLDQFDRADDVFDDLAHREKDLVGYLAEAVPLHRAEVALARKKSESAASYLERLSRDKTVDPEEVLFRWARAVELTGQPDRALAIYRRVYYEFPMSAAADQAAYEINRLEGASLLSPDRFKLELGRAERLFGARRYQPARDALVRLQKVASGDDKEIVALRIAESDYYLKRYAAAREGLRPFLDHAAREAEARFFYLTATRALGEMDAFVSMSRKLVEDFPRDSWSEETLNNLATHHITQDEDDEADAVFREILERFPQSRHAERAAWKSGWHAYRTAQFADAARIFEGAAATFPRGDTRPAWLYWAGRARDQMGDAPGATECYRIAVADYRNSYYGRLASRQLEGRTYQPVPPTVMQDANLTMSTPTESLVRQLIALELYDDALREVQYAQRVWGDSPALIATGAWITHQQGLALTSWERFNRLRGAINTMKRAYPQYIASGGENLPPEVLSIVFPLQYWAIIKKYSEQHDLDPYLIAALVAQESTFTADIKSPANAVGLMQLMPTTGRRYAKKLNLRFTTASLTQAETNIRLGTTYFKDLVDRFGGAYYALASYNAGENRIVRWREENPGLSQDEFIDDIPFPETQNYVKKILGTAEDYRRLYGGGLLVPETGAPAHVAAPGKGGAGSVRKPGSKATKKKPATKKKAATKKSRRTRR